MSTNSFWILSPGLSQVCFGLWTKQWRVMYCLSFCNKRFREPKVKTLEIKMPSAHQNEPSRVPLLMSETLFKKCPRLQLSSCHKGHFRGGSSAAQLSEPPLKQVPLGQQVNLVRPQANSQQSSPLQLTYPFLHRSSPHAASETLITLVRTTPAYSLLPNVSITFLPVGHRLLVSCYFGGFFTAKVFSLP